MNDRVNPAELRRAQEVTDQLMRDALSNPSESIARTILARAGATPDQIERAATINTALGLTAFDLQAPAKNLYPVATPLRNRLKRVPGGTGTGTNWKAITNIAGSGFDAIGWVAEGQRAGNMSYTLVNKNANYATLGEESGVTFEGINAARTFEDVQATMAMRLLQKTFLKEEMALLAGNVSLQLGTPSTPTLSAAGTGATLPALTYSVIVVALTLEGVKNSALAAGIATTKTITGADGATFTLFGGSSIKSANATQAVTLGQTLSASVTPIQGAAAYAWYVGAAGSETLQAISYINSATFSAPLTGGRQAATAVGTSDFSANTGNGVNAFDGLLTTFLKAGSGANVTVMPSGVAGTGSVLTASGRGSVNEIDNMLQNMWDTSQVTPTVLWMNSQEIKNVTGKCLTGASGGSLLQNFKSPEEAYGLVAGGTISYYYNPFMLDGGLRIPVRIHPNIPPGTILGYAEDLPVQYQENEVPNVAEVHIRQDYHQINWPVITRQRQVGVYAEEVLAVYAPFAGGVITNIGNG